VTVQVGVFWDVTLCNLERGYWCSSDLIFPLSLLLEAFCCQDCEFTPNYDPILNVISLLFTLWDVGTPETPTSAYNHCLSVICTVEIWRPWKGPFVHFQNVGELRPLQADLLGSGWGIASQAMRVEVLLKSFWRSLAGFGGQRLGSRPMRSIAVRSVELYWPAITGGADSLLLGRWSLRSRSVEVLLWAW
jgi:hypothetical protein